jgi:hypothetical protein
VKGREKRRARSRRSIPSPFQYKCSLLLNQQPDYYPSPLLFHLTLPSLQRCRVLNLLHHQLPVNLNYASLPLLSVSLFPLLPLIFITDPHLFLPFSARRLPQVRFPSSPLPSHHLLTCSSSHTQRKERLLILLEVRLAELVLSTSDE